MNVVRFKKGQKNFYSLERLCLLLHEIESLGTYIAVVPRYLREKIDDKENYLKLLTENNVKFIEFCPRHKIENDYYFIELAKKTNFPIITNDYLNKLKGIPKEIKENTLPFIFIEINGKIEIILPWKELVQ